LYLKRIQGKDVFHYVLRESYPEKGRWLHRDIMDLGAHPGEYIEYTGGNGFFFRPELEDALAGHGVDYSTEELERVFMPFIDPHIQRVIGMFDRKGSASNCRATPLDKVVESEILRLHSFDKRRLHYLKCGRIDTGDLNSRPLRFLRILLRKSRDEIESMLEGMERILPPREVSNYLYTAFNLGSYFPNSLLRTMPGGLDPEKLDRGFIEAVCSLNEDQEYFNGIEECGDGVLHPYLVRYVILFFDHDFDRSSPWSRYAEEFVGRHRSYENPVVRSALRTDDACRVLGISAREFKELDRKGLARRFRVAAQKRHPDKGGDHEDFVRLCEAYEFLLAKYTPA
jgi:hypothetical protein